MNCPIVSLTLPASFDDFDSAMLNNCNTLTSLNVAEGKRRMRPKTACFSRRTGRHCCITCPRGTDTAYTVPDGTITIAASAFSDNTSLESVTIPASVGNIEANAFSNCSSLAEVTIGEGDTVLVIGDYASAARQSKRSTCLRARRRSETMHSAVPCSLRSRSATTADSLPSAKAPSKERSSKI